MQKYGNNFAKRKYKRKPPAHIDDNASKKLRADVYCAQDELVHHPPVETEPLVTETSDIDFDARGGD